MRFGEPMEDDQVLFELPIEMELRKSERGDRRIVRGYASTEAMDQDGEIILQNGIDFSPLLKSGFLNFDHQGKCLKCGLVHDRSECPGCLSKSGKMPLIIGYPTKAEIRDKGLWLEGELFKSTRETNSDQTRLADEMWELGLNFQKSGGARSLNYSVEGGIIQRSGNKVVRSVVKHCAVTTKPVNTEATIEVFRKSLCCGRCHKDHPLFTPGHSCGSHDHQAEEILKSLGTDAGTPMANGNTPLMKENLDRGFTSLLYGDQQLASPCGCFDPGSLEFKGGVSGAVEHLKKCRGANHSDAITFLRKAVGIAGQRPDVKAALHAAGITR